MNFHFAEIPVTMTVVSGVGHLYGVVMDPSEDDAPVEGALVQVVADFDMHQITNENGEYDFGETPVFNYNLLVTAPDFLPMSEDNIEVEADSDVEVNFSLLHSRCRPDPDIIITNMGSDEELEIDLTLYNSGNGPLSWSMERVFPEGADVEPWEMRMDADIQTPLEDTFIAGVVFADNRFFVSSGNNGENVNKIYILNRDRELIGEFDQFADDRYGMRDLAYDGTLLWGVYNGTFYGFTLDGELETSFEVEADLVGRTIAWDSGNELLWSSDISSNIFGISPDGEVRVELENELRIYGLGYYPEDPDGYHLYVFCRGPDNVGIDVYKINTDNGDQMEVIYLDIGDGRPSGFQITNRWDPYSWVVVGIVQNDDRLAVWHLDNRTDWLLVDPMEGVVEANGSADLTVTLNSGGFSEDELSAELVITHDGVGGETTVSVLLEVTSGGMAQRMLDLPIGWSLISVNVQPEREDVRHVVQPLVDENLLILMKDSQGRFYSPPYDYCDIDYWEGLESYQVLLSGSASLGIAGEIIPWDTAIELGEGWNGVSFLPRSPVDAVVALSGIAESLVIAKDGEGHFYLPAWDDFTNMGNMREGKGYFIYVNEDVQLSYNLGDERLMAKSPPTPPLLKGGLRGDLTFKKGGKDVFVSQSDQAWLSELQPGECSYSLLLLTEGLESGTRLEAYTPSGNLAGRGVVGDDGKCGMALWGKDVGFSTGDAITISIVGSADISVGGVELDWLAGETSGWTADGWGVARLPNEAEIPVEFGLQRAYPNPFNGQLRIDFTLKVSGRASLRVYDLSGREVAEVVNDNFAAGEHSRVWQADGLPSGLYILKLRSAGETRTMKTMLIK